MIHTYARKMQLGRLISSKGSPVAFTHASKPPINKLYNYINKTVKYSGNPAEEFCTILLG